MADQNYIDQWDPIIDASAKQYNVDPRLLKLIINTESGGNPNAPVGSHGEIGIAQFMPDTAKQLGINPTDPYQSIDGAARYLAQGLAASKGDPIGAMRYYNGGPGAQPGGATDAYVDRAAPMYSKLEDPTGSAAKMLQESPTGQGSPPPPPPPQQAANTPASPQTQQSSTASVQSTDPDVIAGEKALANYGSTAQAPTTVQSTDPDVIAGEKALANYGGNSAPTAGGPPPPPVQHSFLNNLGAGIVRGAADTYDDTKNLLSNVANTPIIKSIDQAVPVLGDLDSNLNTTPQQKAALAQQQAQYQTDYGTTLGGKIGYIAGQTAATTPLAIGAGALGGLAVDTGANALGNVLGRSSPEVLDDALATKSGFQPLVDGQHRFADLRNGLNIANRPRIVNVIPGTARVLGTAAVGAGLGAGSAAMTGGDPTVGAVTGAALPIVGPALGPIANYAGNTITEAAKSKAGAVAAALLGPHVASALGATGLSAVEDMMGGLGLQGAIAKYGDKVTSMATNALKYLNGNQLNAGLPGYAGYAAGQGANALGFTNPPNNPNNQ